MPRSKHRRKPGGKAVAHPGHGKSRELPLSPEDVLWRRFVDSYTKPFHEKYGDSAAGGAGDMLDLIEEGAFVATGRGRLQPVSKAAVFREFMASSISKRRSLPVTLKWRSPSLSNREWSRSQATRSPCRPASGPAGSLSPPDPTFQPATGRRRGAGAPAGHVG
jgi:hypothetical protein